MNNEVKVSPTPIQRNLNDVAMELTELYFKRSPATCTIESVQDAYKRFYASAMNAHAMDYETAEQLTKK